MAELMVSAEKKAGRQAVAKGMVQCEECRKDEAKYKCPACSFRSCSLPCVRAHKERTSCSGKRDRTCFVPIDTFDDTQLLSDYHLLEEILKQSESARRFRVPFNTRKLERYDRLMVLKRQARRRKINLVILPRGMTKRTENSTRYCKRKSCIFWRIEWHFHSTDYVLITTGILRVCTLTLPVVTYDSKPNDHENESLAKILEQQLCGDGKSRKDQLVKIRKFCKNPIEAMRFLVVKQMCKVKEKVYIELDPLEPFGAQLDQMTVIEFPAVLVVSPADDTKFTIVENRRSNFAVKKVDGVTEKLLADASVVEGLPYREEEIEEGEIVD